MQQEVRAGRLLQGAAEGGHELVRQLADKPDRVGEEHDLPPGKPPPPYGGIEGGEEAILGQRKNVPRKPDPTGALEAAQILNISPLDFLYLGDSAVDMKTALAAGMFPVGALWGFRPAKELRQSGARALINEPPEILNLLESE